MAVAELASTGARRDQRAIQAAIGALNVPVAVGLPLVVLALAVGYGVLRGDVVPREVRVTPPR